MEYNIQGTEEILYEQNEIFDDAFINRHSKKKLTSEGLNFKRDFAGKFTKERLSKVKVERIHRYIQERIDIPHFNREHRRCLVLYYNEFAEYYNIIMSFIRQHKDEILEIL